VQAQRRDTKKCRVLIAPGNVGSWPILLQKSFEFFDEQ
jgi:hypothetical protein